MKHRKRGSAYCSNPKRGKAGVYIRCWSADADVCSGCASLNELHVKKMLGSGMSDLSSEYYLFTLTAPSFGKIHAVPHSIDDSVRKCACGEIHEYGDALAGVPLDMKRYRYRDTAEWNHNFSEFFRRTMLGLGKKLPEMEWAAIREFQNRAALHIHILVRLPETVDSKRAVKAMMNAKTYHYGKFSYGKYVDVRSVRLGTYDSTVRYMAKVVKYNSMAQTAESAKLSVEQKEFFSKMTAACVRLGYSEKAVRHFGYGGNIFSRSEGWCEETKDSLRQEMREYAAATYGENEAVEINEKALSEKSVVLREIAKAHDNAEDYMPALSGPDRVRARLTGYRGKMLAKSSETVLSSADVEEALSELENMDFLSS